MSLDSPRYRGVIAVVAMSWRESPVDRRIRGTWRSFPYRQRALERTVSTWPDDES